MFIYISDQHGGLRKHCSVVRPAVYAGMQDLCKKRSINMSKKKHIPERVKLRDESQRDVGQWLGLIWGLGEESDYVYKPDAELDAIIEKSEGNSIFALQMWYEAVKPNLRNNRGVHLIPGPIQKLLNLPLRQIYIDKDIDVLHRIDPESDKCHGRVTDRLL